MKGSKGFRKGTRKKLRKKRRERGKFSISRFLAEYEEGTKVVISPEPSFHKGMPFRRFIGKIGTVIGRRGRSYIVKIRDGGKDKILFIHPAHLRVI